jgi:hypothetical protein
MPGAIGEHVNVFAGLLRHARDGDTYFATTRSHNHPQKGRVRWRVLINTASDGRSATCWSFPFDSFEAAILSMLREIDPHEILNGDQGPDEALALAGRVAEVDSAIALIEADLDEHGESAALFRRLRAKEAEKRDLDAKLREAQQKAANPLSASWGEAQTLLGALDAAPDQHDARLRLRSALRRIVDSLWLLPVPRGRFRLCAVQVWFAGGERCRSYVILHRGANAAAKSDSRWWARSLSEVAAAGALDLRRREHAAELETALQAVDLDALAEALGN